MDSLELRKILVDEADKLSQEANKLPSDIGSNIQSIAKLEISKALLSLSARIGKVQS